MPLVPQKPGYPEDCQSCAFLDSCLASDISMKYMSKFFGRVREKRQIRRGELLYKQGDRFRRVFMIRSGMVKIMVHDGEDHITGFGLPGEIVGLDGLNGGHHTRTAMTLVDSIICVFSYESMSQLLCEIPDIRLKLIKNISRQIEYTQRFSRIQADWTAEQRVAGFLMNLDSRYNRPSRFGGQFELGMRQKDIADYLGLTKETVSRNLSLFRARGLIEMNNKTVTILRRDVLEEITKENEFNTQRIAL